MNNKETASIDDLIDLLYEQKRHPDLDLIRALLERGDEAIPDLIAVVEIDHDWAKIHAGLLLCELRAESSLPTLEEVLSSPDGHALADWLVDDALEKFGPAALDMLEAVAANKEVEWYQRAVACRVMVPIAYRHPETYERVTAFLRSLLPDPNLDWRSYEDYETIKKEVDDPQIWSSVAGRLTDLRDPDAYDLIGQLFQGGLIDELYINPTSYEKAYQQPDPPTWVTEEPKDLLVRYERSRPKPTVPTKKSWKKLWAKKKKRKKKRKKK
jgi:hypothetical protein